MDVENKITFLLNSCTIYSHLIQVTTMLLLRMIKNQRETRMHSQNTSFLRVCLLLNLSRTSGPAFFDIRKVYYAYYITIFWFYHQTHLYLGNFTLLAYTYR